MFFSLHENSSEKFKYMGCKMPKSDPYALLYIAPSRLPGFYEPKVSESDAYAPAAMPAERNNNTAKRYGFAVLYIMYGSLISRMRFSSCDKQTQPPLQQVQATSQPMPRRQESPLCGAIADRTSRQECACRRELSAHATHSRRDQS